LHLYSSNLFPPRALPDESWSLNPTEVGLRLLAAGYKHSTAELTVKVLRQLAKHVSLIDPEAVLRFIASKQVSNSRKELLITAYERWLRLQGLKVKLAKPRRVNTS